MYGPSPAGCGGIDSKGLHIGLLRPIPGLRLKHLLHPVPGLLLVTPSPLLLGLPHKVLIDDNVMPIVLHIHVGINL